MMGWLRGGLGLGMVGEKVDEEVRAAVEEVADDGVVVVLRSIQEVEGEDWGDGVGEGE